MIFKAFLLWIICSNLALYGKAVSARVESPYAVLMNASNGAVLFERGSHEKIHPASTTKIATALFVLQLTSDLDQMIRAPKEVLKSVSRKYKDEHIDSLPPYILQKDGTSFGILEGEELSIKSLLYGLLLSSGNDAANVLAYHFGKGDITAFMKDMNKYLSSIGCKETNFCNPHGLHHKLQVSSPYDMALIGRFAIKNRILADIVKAEHYLRPKTNKQEERIIKQPNRLVVPGKLHFEEAIGMKTGYTQNAGYCLVAAASDGKRDLVAALFHAKEDPIRYRDAISLFSAAFEEEPASRKLFEKGSEFVQKEGRAKLHEDVVVSVYPSEIDLLQAEADSNLLSIRIGDQIIASYPIHLKKIEVPAKKHHRWWLALLVIALGLLIKLGNVFFRQFFNPNRWGES